MSPMVKAVQYVIILGLLTGTCSLGQTCQIPWSDAVRLSDDQFLSLSPRITGTHDEIHVIWFNLDTTFTSENAGIYYTRSVDTGNSFSPPVIILNASAAINSGIITKSGSCVIVACYGILGAKTGTIICRSEDGGASWQTPALIQERSYPQTIATVNSQVIIQFATIGSASKGIITSQDGGASWQVVNNTSPQFTDLVSTQDFLHGVGPANRETGTEVGYYSSFNQGRNWYGPDVISADDGVPSLYPKIAATGNGTLYVTWHESGIIYLRRSSVYDDEGTLLWDPPLVISEGISNNFPDIAIHNRNIAVVWERRENENYNVNFRYSGDGGYNFCPSDLPSPFNEGSEPAIMLTGDTAHIVWNSSTPAGAEIFYRLGILDEFLTGTTPILRQNYPNPVLSQTTIEFEIQSTEFVKIVLYNLLGQKITTLLEGTYGPGTHFVPLKVTDMSSGVYFYRLLTRNSGATKKLIILR